MLLSNQAFNFYVINKSFTDSSGAYEKLDLIVHDKKTNGKFDLLEDRILAGPINNNGMWAGTVFIIDFNNSDSSSLPKADDVYHIEFKRPFWVTDSLLFTVQPEGELDRNDIKTTMDKIKVVPNPYVATNAMEPAVMNNAINQPRRLMFTHLPAQCTIKIFTMSGILVDEIIVNNPADNGITHWDLLTKEGLEVAAGIYIFHIKAYKTGDIKMGKFAIIK